MKKKCIIFGCGQIGTAAYLKLKSIYDILAWSDNNKELWGQKKNDVLIIPPARISEYDTFSDLDVVVTIGESEPIIEQLLSLKTRSIVIYKAGLLFQYRSEGYMLPYQCDMEYIVDTNENVLFVQTEACIRTHKIAKALKNSGKKVYLAYLMAPPTVSNPEYSQIYETTIPIISFDSFIDFVNHSNFEYVHSSNEPDILSMLLGYCNKAIIHDCHDLSSAYKRMTPEELTIEYIAHKKSAGIIYTTENIRQQAVKKYHLEKERTFVLGNLISEELSPKEYLPKLSSIDGELHCVYEGGVVAGDRSSHRYFEEIWKKIAQAGVHIHFYTNCQQEYCNHLESIHPNIHYEGNCSSMELVTEMTQYDVGLYALNITHHNKKYAEFASPNKIQEYVSAGLPVAVTEVESIIEYVDKNVKLRDSSK